MGIAEKKLLENDCYGARTFINQAKSLYTNLDCLKQVLTMIYVFISASPIGVREVNKTLGLFLHLGQEKETRRTSHVKLVFLNFIYVYFTTV